MNSNASHAQVSRYPTQSTESLLTYLHPHRGPHPKYAAPDHHSGNLRKPLGPTRVFLAEIPDGVFESRQLVGVRAVRKQNKSYNYFPSFRKYSTAADLAQVSGGRLALPAPSQTPTHRARGQLQPLQNC